MATPASALVGYAVLRANYNAEAPSYLDNFRPFMLSVLAKSNQPFLEKGAISKSIRDDFGITIPSHVVGKLIRRTNKSGLTRKVGDDATTLTEEGLSSAPAIADDITQYQRKQDELVAHFREFVARHFPQHVEMLEQDLARALAEYFDRQAVPLLNEGLRGRARLGDDSPGLEFLVSAFVSHLAHTDQTRFAYVVEAAKGAMLASVLVLDTSGLSESLSQLSLVLDTPVLMDVLGFHGEVPQAATTQVLDLARSQGGRLVTFEHCVGEVDGILDSIESALRRGSSRSTAAGYLHFVETGAGPADLAVLKGRIVELLSRRGVAVIGRPDNYYEHGLDERRLEETLQQKVNYFQDSTRLNDVLSLSAVHRLRRGAKDRSLERCGALMVTSNGKLAFAAVEFDRNGTSFPLAMTLENLASILWVRTPAAATDVPKQVLLAAAFAGMQPSVGLWSRYLDEIDKLEEGHSVSAEEAIVLRSSRLSRDTLMEETLGDPESVTAASPLEVLERMKAEVTAPLKEQVELLTKQNQEVTEAANHATADWLVQDSAREQAEAGVKQREVEEAALAAKIAELEQKQMEQGQEQQARRDRIKKRAERKARSRRIWISRTLIAVFILLLVVAIVLFLMGPQGVLGVSIVGVCTILGLVGLCFPAPGQWLDKWESRKATSLQEQLLADAGMQVTEG